MFACLDSQFLALFMMILDVITLNITSWCRYDCVL